MKEDETMGILREKYTREYFTGRDVNGNKLPYGATAYLNEHGEYVLREHDLQIVSRVNFKDKAVLEFGVGRGECARYILEKDAKAYIGVDFSEAALEIAREVTKNSEKKPVFYCQDALEFINAYLTSATEKFDVVIMLDVIEHIPRSELSEILTKLKKIMSEKSVLVISTPAYKYDNDVVLDGLDARNNGEDGVDTSDLRDETAGMHCNKYSLISLQAYFAKCGFLNISECSFFVPKARKENMLYKPYIESWKECFQHGYPIGEAYRTDIPEYAYKRKEKPALSKFEEGSMAGIQLLCTNEYRDAVYSKGEYDSKMFDDFKSYGKHVKNVIDIGGFVGVSSMLFAKYMGDDGNVLTIEPNPWNINRIFVNLSLNSHLNSKVSLLKAAAGDQNCEQTMILSSNIDCGYSSTSRLFDAHAKIAHTNLPEGFYRETVSVKTLDTIVKEHHIIPDVIKVDIEGAEHLFLQGAKSTLSAYHPVIYMELHSEFCAVKCMELFYELKYRVNILFEEKDNRLLIKAEYQNK